MIREEDIFSEKIESSLHKTIKKVTEDYETLKFNTAIAAMMSLINEIYDIGGITKKDYQTFLILLNPVAPHVTEELWQLMEFDGFLN
jgi:leucyl-tRNA synthetase